MRALIADVDDTMCPSTRPIAPALAEQVARVVRSGRHFAFISGSTLDQIAGQLASLSVDHHLLGASGTHYARVSATPQGLKRTEVYREAFSPAQRDEILAAFEDLIQAYGIRSLTTKADQLQDRGSQITLSALGRGAPEDKKRALDPDGSLRRRWVEHLKGSLGERYSIKVGGTSSIDITPPGVDKAWGIRRFLKENGLRPEEAFFIGDKLEPGGNDYPARSVVECRQVSGPEDSLKFLSQLELD